MNRTEDILEWLEGPAEPGSDDILEWLSGRGEALREDSPKQAGRCGCADSAEAIPREDLFGEAIKYRRKDVRCLTAAEETNLLDAMQTLADNGTWGDFVDRHVRHGAGIHGTLTPAQATDDDRHGRRARPGSGNRDPDPAGGPDISRENAVNRFLPWHRLFLLEFEDELRAIDSSIALPYWSWSEQPGLPSIISRSPWVIKGTGSGDLTVTRAPGRPEDLPSTGEVDGVLSNTTFRDFTWALETIHNTVHDWVGGTMGRPPISPADPVFWMVHAEVDRIWVRWTNSKVGERARLRRENRPVIVAGSNELPGITMAKRGNRVPSLIWTTRALNLGYGYDRLEDAVKSTCARP